MCKNTHVQKKKCSHNNLSSFIAHWQNCIMYTFYVVYTLRSIKKKDITNKLLKKKSKEIACNICNILNPNGLLAIFATILRVDLMREKNIALRLILYASNKIKSTL